MESAAEFAGHLVQLANRSDAMHVMWLNRYVTKHMISEVELERLLLGRIAGNPGKGTVPR